MVAVSFSTIKGTSTELIPVPDFVKLADKLRIAGYRVQSPDEKICAGTALNHPGAVVVDIVIDREENVYPMVPGRNINKDDWGKT